MPVPAAGIAIGIASFIWRMLAYVTPYVVGSVIASLGIGFITYIGMDFLVDLAIEKVRLSFSGLPSAALELLKLTGVIDAFNIFVSGVISGLTAKYARWRTGRLKKFVLNA